MISNVMTMMMMMMMMMMMITTCYDECHALVRGEYITSGRNAKNCGCVIRNIIAGTVGDSIGRLELTS